MRRTCPALAVLLALVCAVATVVPSSAAQRAGSCGDSWDPDGHNGPWYTGSNQTLHGNTLHIGGANCGANTAWNVTYTVHKTDGQGADFTPISTVRNGNGPTSWSVATSPVGCNPGWLYYTQVRNNLTGNYIRQPQNGTVIC